MTATEGRIVSQGADEEPPAGYERDLAPGMARLAFIAASVIYAAWHLYVLNIAPLETWTFRILHVAGALSLGFALALPIAGKPEGMWPSAPAKARLGADALAAALLAWPLLALGMAWFGVLSGAAPKPSIGAFAGFGPLLFAGSAVAIVAGWLLPAPARHTPRGDALLILASVMVAGFILLSIDHFGLRLRAGTRLADPNNGWAALTGVLLILELTRRVAGLALVAIASIFVVYAFIGPWLPGILEHGGYPVWRFFSYIYTDNGVLGATTAVSSTYIMLFIVFAAFLNASKVGDYFVNFAFAAAGGARGGPAKVAVFASGLMGMINGTSAGNVVATGSLTIPLMKKVGYKAKTAASVEAAASTGGQIMPPIMGAGAFIMAEITGIPYTELVVHAIIPAVLYFASVYFMVDFEARRLGMQGLPRDELPIFGDLIKRAYLFIPVLILIGALFAGYSVIRAGTLATAAAFVASWMTPHRMGAKAVLTAFALASRMGIQIIAVCACAGIIVGVIALTGVGARFSSLLLAIAGSSQLVALVFAMLISIVLGMGMPTTAAYAVAASVVAPGLIQLGISPLTAHFFVFYYAVVSAITPPVALASYAGAAIAGSSPMATSVESFRIGIAAFIVPFMFFYAPGLLLNAPWLEVIMNLATALAGVWMLSAGAIGYFYGKLSLPLRGLLLTASLLMISGSLLTDAIGVALGVGVWLLQTRLLPKTA